MAESLPLPIKDHQRADDMIIVTNDIIRLH
jgi:hypothetical protein